VNSTIFATPPREKGIGVRAYPPQIAISPLSRALGVVLLPGSKSISNRVLLLAALSEGVTDVGGLLDSDDTRVMLEALAQLGVVLERGVGNDIRVRGVGGAFPVKQAKLFLGNAGTAFRPLTAALAMMDGRYELSGVARMHERPIGDLIEALAAIGADVAYMGNPGYPPLSIGARRTVPSKTTELSVRGDVSSQFLSAALMAMPLCGGNARVTVIGELISKPYVDITTNLMARFGVSVKSDARGAFVFDESAGYRAPGRLCVEGDASSASYFLAAGALGGGPVRVNGVGRESIQGDVKFADALETMGASIVWGENWIEASAPKTGKLKAIDADFNHIPDAAMTIAALALFADGVTTLRNIASWRVKETDRLAAMATELRKFGATVETGPDFLRVVPPATIQTPDDAIRTYDDHRIAMCFSLCALGGVAVTIDDPKCVAKTFPDFFDVFASISQ
jgi:3-phosphoshikimate 1-carboxyvinyltransferase